MFFKLPAIEPGSESTSIGKYKTISGYIKDSQNGESLAGATIQIKETKTATSSNAYGFYSINVLPGKYTIEFSYVGFNVVSQTINVSDNLVLNIELTEAPQEIKEVIVRSETTIDKLRKPEMSVTKLETKTIKSIPALMGEVDVIKVIQMLPGVQSTSEGTSGFSVRGGGIDQNLVLLDDASIYNASHMMGFFSVFNNDVVKDIKLYKGDLPAQYGGRLSSVLDIKTKDGNNKTWNTTGGIGLISSRLTVEGPIQQDKTSILISGRRTYADIFFPFFKDKELRKSYMYFYDANIKLSSHINDKNHIFISGYTGNDHFGQKDFADMQFGNDELSIRWNHQYSGKLFSNITVFSTRYGYHMKADLGEMKYYWNSNITDYGIKIDYSLFPNPNNELKFGISTILHKINPIDAWAENDTTDSSFPDMSSNSLEHGIYLTNQQKIGDKLTIKYGLRYSVFQN